MFYDNSPPIREVVLLVDDEDSVRRLIRRVLESSGYVVLDACNGKEGLALCLTHPGVIDILIADVVMPELGGHELAAAARELRPNIVVLLISGYSRDEVFDQRRHSRTAFLQKPFSGDTLQQTVRSTLACAAAA